jgi:hypothetical protein
MERYTEQEFLSLKVEEQNRIVAEAMGKCWHEWNESGTGCEKCSTNFEDARNLDYLQSAEGLKEMLEFRVNEGSIELGKARDERYWARDCIIQINNYKSLNLALALAILKSKGVIND